MEETRPKLPDKGDYFAVLGSAIAPIAVLVWGMGSGNSYGYYIFLRVVVCFCAFVLSCLLLFAPATSEKGCGSCSALFVFCTIL